MNIGTYKEKENQILDDTERYQRVETTAETLEEKVKTQYIKSMKSLKDNFPTDVYNGWPQNSMVSTKSTKKEGSTLTSSSSI